MCLALRASGLWLRYATLQNLIPSFPWIVPHALHPGAIQGMEGIKFCLLATLNIAPLGSERIYSVNMVGRVDGRRHYRTRLPLFTSSGLLHNSFIVTSSSSATGKSNSREQSCTGSCDGQSRKPTIFCQSQPCLTTILTRCDQF